MPRDVDRLNVEPGARTPPTEFLNSVSPVNALPSTTSASMPLVCPGVASVRTSKPATLVLFGDDYDGGHKAWVRWPDGRDDIVPGSQVQRG